MNTSIMKTLNIDSLIVNTENPRSEPTFDEIDAIYTLASDQGKKLINLAKSIALDGLNPSENIIISKIKDTNLYIVREGNRRITCLKILKNIDKYTSIKNFKTFKSISASVTNKNIFTVNCCIINEDETVNKWINLKHTGENGGVGTVKWDTDSQDRFKEQTGQIASTGFLAYKFLQDFGYTFPKKPPITTLTRILNSQYGKEYFKFYLFKGNLVNNNTPEELLNKLGKLCNLVLDSNIINSRKGNTATEIEIFIKKYFNDEVPYIQPEQTSLFNNHNLNTGTNTSSTRTNNSNNGTSTSSTGTSTSSTGTNTSSTDTNTSSTDTNTSSTGTNTSSTDTNTSSTRIKSITPTSKRKTVIPSTFKIRTHESKINNLISELKQLDVENFPNACSVSLRVLIEISIDYYGTVTNCFAGKHANTLSDKLKLTKKHLSLHGYTEEQLVPFDKIFLSPDTIYSTNTFNKYVHHVRFQATPSDLKIAWDNIQEFIEIFLAN